MGVLPVSILEEGGRLDLKYLLLSYFRVGDFPGGRQSDRNSENRKSPARLARRPLLAKWRTTSVQLLQKTRTRAQPK